jgi:hypothetical protein
MSTCEGCANEGHGPEECSNRGLPMCHQTCTCRHGEPERDPAPYWTAIAAAETNGAGA